MTSDLRLAALFALSALTACAAPGSVSTEPVSAFIGGTRLSVEFADGRACHADLGADGGSGTFADCPAGASYDVTIHRPSYLEPVFGAAFSAYADVAVTDARGRVTRFKTPMKSAG